jgi:hypothetical protein
MPAYEVRKETECVGGGVGGRDWVCYVGMHVRVHVYVSVFVCVFACTVYIRVFLCTTLYVIFLALGHQCLLQSPRSAPQRPHCFLQ